MCSNSMFCDIVILKGTKYNIHKTPVHVNGKDEVICSTLVEGGLPHEFSVAVYKIQEIVLRLTV